MFGATVRKGGALQNAFDVGSVSSAWIPSWRQRGDPSCFEPGLARFGSALRSTFLSLGNTRSWPGQWLLLTRFWDQELRGLCAGGEWYDGEYCEQYGYEFEFHDRTLSINFATTSYEFIDYQGLATDTFDELVTRTPIGSRRCMSVLSGSQQST